MDDVQAKLDKLWDVYDTDKSGYIDELEAHKMFEEIFGLYHKKAVKDVFTKLDATKDGKIEKAEFAKIVMEMPFEEWEREFALEDKMRPGAAR